MPEKIQRIGLWGGSFNPPTLAHKALAEYVFSCLSLDRLLWIVSPNNPEKDPAQLAPFDHRLAMVARVLAGMPGMQASDIEQRNGSSWTIDTVKLLRRDFPDDFLFLIIGADNWLGFHGWGDGFDEILQHVSIVVLRRPGYGVDAEAARLFADKQVAGPENLKKSGSWCPVDNPLIDMSATSVRHSVAKGERSTSIQAETADYIRTHGLYRNQHGQH